MRFWSGAAYGLGTDGRGVTGCEVPFFITKCPLLRGFLFDPSQKIRRHCKPHRLVTSNVGEITSNAGEITSNAREIASNVGKIASNAGELER